MTALPPETVARRPPVNLGPGDSWLFEHEYSKTFPAVNLRCGTWDSTPDGMLLSPGSARAEPAWFQSGRVGLKAALKGWHARLSQPRRSLVSSKQPLVVTDEFSNGYFHWVADALPKLWWLRQSLEQHALVLPAFSERFAYMRQTLALWPQLEIATIAPRTRVELHDACLVPALAPTGNYRPHLMQGLALAWREHVGAKAATRRTYISRAKAPWRKIRNEDQLWPALQAQGFERVFLEDLNFADQVRLIAETALLVSNHGAGLTNLMFLPPGAKVVEIRLRGDAGNNCYFSLASAVGVDYAYLLADPVDASHNSHTADLRVDVSALRTLVLGLT